MTIATLDTYDSVVAAEVRATVARHGRVKQKQIADAFGQDENWVSRRMNGKTPWSIGELVQLATLFRCELADLLPHLDSNQKPFGYRLQSPPING